MKYSIVFRLTLLSCLAFSAAEYSFSQTANTINTYKIDNSYSTLTGVAFDAPVNIQITFPSKITIINFSYLKIPPYEFRKYKNSVNPNLADYIKDILGKSSGDAFKNVKLRGQDSLKHNAGDDTYTLSVHLADYNIYLDPNSHYLFTVVSPFFQTMIIPIV